MASTNAANKMYDMILGTRNIDESSLEKAKELFVEYKNRGIIRGGFFEDEKWYFTDEYSNMSIRFEVPEFEYHKYYKDILGLSYQEFIDYLKTYVMFILGDVILDTIRDIVYDIKKLMQYDPEELYATSEDVFLHHPSRVIELFSMFSEQARTEKMEHLLNVLDYLIDYRYERNSTESRRQLASFDSYFLFNDIIKDYWKSDIPYDERLFFYPLYLWWEITGVLPLRPREFILTPRNCIEKTENGYLISLRRNQIKGSSKKISYKIESDYCIVKYQIPEKLALQIIKYIDFTKQFESTDLDTLFITDTHYRQWKQKKHCNSRYFTYVNLNCVMRYFFHDIIIGRYGLKVLYERELQPLEDGYIHYMYLGDSRHLSLINIIAEGGTPMIAMMLAGHDQMEMASHYYSNITSLIECRTYRQYRKVLKGNVTYEISQNVQLPIGIKEFSKLEDGGKCYSEKFLRHDFEDCKNIVGPNGEIGYCPNCPFYRRKHSRDFFKSDDLYKRKVEEECKHLAMIVKQARQDKGNSDDILQAMMRLQHSTYTYQQYLEEKLLLMQKEKDNV